MAEPQATHVDLDDLRMDAARSPSAAYAAARDRILVRACLLELTQVERQVLELHLFHGWTVDEIGRYVGASEVEVGVCIDEHVQRLRHRHGNVSVVQAAAASWIECHQWPVAAPERAAERWPSARSA